MARHRARQPLWLVALLGLWLTTAQAALVDAPSVRVTLTDAGLVVELPSTVPGDVFVVDTGNGLLVTFPAPFDGTPLDGLIGKAPGWLTDLRYGYDALLLVPEQAVTVTTETRADAVVVTLSRSGSPATTDAGLEAGSDDGSALRLSRLDAVVRHRAGDSLVARSLLRSLMENDPTDTQTMADLAEVERSLGRIEQSIALYSRAAGTDGVPELERAKAGLLADLAPTVTVRHQFVSVLAAEDQARTTLEASGPFGQRLRLDLRTEYRHIRTPVVLDPVSGLTSAFEGARARIRLHADVNDLGPGRARFSAYASRRVTGAGAGYALRTNAGLTSAELTWHAPYWEFVSGVVHDGWRDRATVRYATRDEGPFNLDLAVAGNRYGLHAVGALVHSIEAELSARVVVRAAEPFLSAGYRLSTEHHGTTTTRIDRFGNRFEPIGFSDSEVHQVDVFIAERLTDYVQISAGGGYSVDRRASRGPFMNASVTWSPLPGFEVTLDASHTESSSSGSGGATTTAAALLRLRF